MVALQRTTPIKRRGPRKRILTPPVAGQASLAQVAYDAILARILDGQIRSPNPISEAQLAAEIGLSRTPVREALGRLEGEGIVQRSGRLLTVKTGTIQDYLEVLHMRRLIEAEAVVQAIGRIPEATLKELRAAVVQLSEAPAAAKSHWIVDDRLHNTIAEASNSRLMLEAIVDLRRKTMLFDFAIQRATDIPEKHGHLEIIDAMLDLDAERAANAMRAHIDHVRDSILADLRKLG